LNNLTTGERSNIPDKAVLINSDLRDEDALACTIEDIHLFFHEAALVSVARSVEEPQTSHEINAEATLSLLEAAQNENARVVLASSAAIYGHLESVPIKETDPKEPTSRYGLDKLATDHYARLTTTSTISRPSPCAISTSTDRDRSRATTAV